MNTVKLSLAAAAVLAALASAAADAKPLEIKLQYASTGQFVPLIPLAPKELYRHYGNSYTVEPIFMAGAGPALTAFAANEIHLAALNPQSIGNAVLTAKLDPRSIVGVITTDMPGYSASAVYCHDGIKSFADVRGKTVGINTRGSTPEAAIRVMLGRHGLKDGVDYQPVEMNFAASLPALDAKRVDCTVLVPPFNNLAASRPGLRVLFRLGEVMGASESVTWVGKPEWIAQNRAALVDFVEDHIRFRRWALDPKTQPEAVKLAAQVSKQSVESIAYLYTDKDNFHHPEGAIDAARFQKNFDDLHAFGLLPGTIEAKKYLDLSIQQEAVARLKTH